jgi:hypothetical protein
MKTNSLLLIVLFCAVTVGSSFNTSSPVYDIEKKLRGGDKEALFEIAEYFDSKIKVTGTLLHDLFHTTEGDIAKRIVRENCIFTEAEIYIDENTSSEDFILFLEDNEKELVFSDIAKAFIVTPLEKRTSKILFREISAFERKELEGARQLLMNYDWVKKNGIDSFILLHDPKSLLMIASEFYKRRQRFYYYYANCEEFTDALKLLTNMNFAVENQRGEVSWYFAVENDYTSYLNLLIYFTNNYSKFKWDEKNHFFRNEEIWIEPIGKEAALFHLLRGKNDSLASEAYIELCTSSPAKVKELIKEFKRGPTGRVSPERLENLSILTDYCRSNGIDYNGSDRLMIDLEKLASRLTFHERRKFEDSLIMSLTLGEITAFEYHTILKSELMSLNLSASRILDIFYSKNWHQILNSDKHLKLFLKKSKLFRELGYEVCDRYLNKFIGLKSAGKEKLKSLQTHDDDILEQIEEAKFLCNKHLMSSPYVNTDTIFSDQFLRDKIDELVKIEDSGIKEKKLGDFLNRISYSQIGIALREIDSIPFKYNYGKYSFMEGWCFFMIDQFYDSLTNTDFLKLYDSLSEYQLYAYFLDKGGIDYKNKDGSLNYDNIYDILKYNDHDGFTSAVFGRSEVFSIIKILEITLQKTLGFSQKLSDEINCRQRALVWMKYLVDEDLLKEAHNDPVSFSYITDMQ